MRHVDGVTVTWLACVVCHIRMDWRPSTIKAELTRNFDRIPDWDVGICHKRFGNLLSQSRPWNDRRKFIEISEIWEFLEFWRNSMICTNWIKFELKLIFSKVQWSFIYIYKCFFDVLVVARYSLKMEHFKHAYVENKKRIFVLIMQMQKTCKY